MDFLQSLWNDGSTPEGSPMMTEQEGSETTFGCLLILLLAYCGSQALTFLMSLKWRIHVDMNVQYLKFKNWWISLNWNKEFKNESVFYKWHRTNFFINARHFNSNLSECQFSKNPDKSWIDLEFLVISIVQWNF